MIKKYQTIPVPVDQLGNILNAWFTDNEGFIVHITEITPNPYGGNAIQYVTLYKEEAEDVQ